MGSSGITRYKAGKSESKSLESKLYKELPRSDQSLQNPRREKAHLNHCLPSPQLFFFSRLCCHSGVLKPILFFKLPAVSTLLSSLSRAPSRSTRRSCLTFQVLALVSHLGTSAFPWERVFYHQNPPLVTWGTEFSRETLSPVLCCINTTLCWTPSHLDLHRLKVLLYLEKCLLLNQIHPAAIFYIPLPDKL